MCYPRDTVIEHKGCAIQHGPLSNRVYLMSPCLPFPRHLEHELIAMARKNRHSKVFAKVPLSCSGPFVRAGYREEAQIPAGSAGKEGLSFLAYYTDEARTQEPDAELFDSILEDSLKPRSSVILSATPPIALPKPRLCTADDIPAMTALYATVFKSYPFPVFEAEFLRETMQEHVRYYCMEMRGELAALASADMDTTLGHVEMTDFATLKAWRGRGFAKHLLNHMESEMQELGLETAYTIARACSPGMNRTFAVLGYTFAGRLVNNTHISGRIESMNVWYKALGALQNGSTMPG